MPHICKFLHNWPQRARVQRKDFLLFKCITLVVVVISGLICFFTLFFSSFDVVFFSLLSVPSSIVFEYSMKKIKPKQKPYTHTHTLNWLKMYSNVYELNASIKTIECVYYFINFVIFFNLYRCAHDYKTTNQFSKRTTV